MRELQLTDAATGLAEVFDDIAAAVEDCRFSNCGHMAEPGCGVQAAVARGELSTTRLDRWRRLSAEEHLNSVSLAKRRRAVR